MTIEVNVRYRDGSAETFRVAGGNVEADNLTLYNDKNQLQFLIPLSGIAGVEYRHDVE